MLFLQWEWPEVDLFASQNNVVLPVFFLVNHQDNQAKVFDALHQLWEFLLGYAFPPPSHSSDASQIGIVECSEHSHSPMMARCNVAGGGNCALPASPETALVECRHEALHW